MSRQNIRMDVFWLKLLLPLVLGGILLFGWKTFANVRRQRQARIYPTTTGRIYTSETVRQWHPGGRHGRPYYTYDVHISYGYELGGRKYVGNRYRYGEVNSDAWAAEVVKAFLPDAEIKVYYRPDDPSGAVLNFDTANYDVGLLIVLLLVLGLFLFLGALTIEQSRGITHGGTLVVGVKVIRQDAQTAVRICSWPPLIAGFCVAGCIVGPLSFWFLFECAELNPGGTVPGLWALLFCLAGWALGGLACLARWTVLNAGGSDIVIDAASQTVSLPREFGRKDRVHIEFSKLAAVVVQSIPIMPGIRWSNYVPTLIVRGRDSDGYKLTSNAVQKQAEAFAAWMRNELRLSAGDRVTNSAT